MIENVVRAAFPSVFIPFFLLSCTAHKGVPEGFQGVVEYEERVVAFEAAGRVERVGAVRGDVLTDGQEIARVDDSIATLVRDARVQDVNVAKADLAIVKAGSRNQDVAAQADELKAAIASEELQRKAHERISELTRTGSFAKAELDKADADLERAVAQRKAIASRLSALKQGARPEEISRAEVRVHQAEAALALEEARLRRSVLTAKGAGVVLDVLIKAGEFANVGAGALTVADTAHPFADVFVPEKDLAGIGVGKKAHVVIDQDARPLGAVVEHVSHTTEFTPKFVFSPEERAHLMVRVRIRIDDPEKRLHAGVPAFATIER